MSTNPFRRSSLKGPASSSPLNIPLRSADDRGSVPGSLSVDTKVTSAAQKHVNFASPPAIPISPVSYPPSPESTRLEQPSTFSSPNSSFSQTTDYSRALASDPFAAETSEGEDDSAIEQALRNRRANATSTTTAPDTEHPIKGSSVAETLGRFASGPPRAHVSQEPSKPALDVNAFTKLLLTGESGVSPPRELAQVGQSTPASHGQPVSESSSSADTASISQHSIFETAPPAHGESPRSSFEADSNEPSDLRASTEGKKKPPPPKSRRGKPLRDSAGEQDSKQNFDNFINSLSLPSSRSSGAETTESRSQTLDSSHSQSHSHSPPTDTTSGPSNVSEASQKRPPPAPPLARRKSQLASSKPILTRSSSSRYSVLSDHDSPVSPSGIGTGFKIPPPPPAARRTTNSGEQRPPLDGQSVSEDAPAGGRAGSLEPHSAEDRPALTQTPSYMKRMSQGLPPPVPPPRRGRGSSRSSVDTQRPSMATLGMTGTDSGDVTPRNQSLTQRDILADLAALQKEVDAARAAAG